MRKEARSKFIRAQPIERLLFIEEDLLQLAERFQPPQLEQPSEPPQISEPKPEATNLASAEKIKEIVTRYQEQLGEDRPSKDRLDLFARDKYGLIGHRDELRAEYDRRWPNQRGGRTRKNSAK